MKILAFVCLALCLAHLVDIQAKQTERSHPLPALARALYPLPD
jgi:hypothetical protein